MSAAGCAASVSAAGILFVEPRTDSRGAFAAGPFDALLVGTCGVQAWSAPLVRLLSADARKVVESFLRPRITERAATVLRSPRRSS